MKSGLWRHPSGSELDLTIHADGSLTGRYRTAGGRPGLATWFPLTGFRNGDLLGFVVSWGEYHSLTSWCGRYVVEKDGREALRTTWLLGRMFADKALSEPTAPWETFHINTDTYYFVAPPASAI
ncbi:MAG: hypothetical protein GC129_05070 [Proteobacteria bacterium]|nr:hypothetical protein [Pseudomonadota bacterium]